ncbi:hypothetical protein CPB85DRAFT_54522 [Mucidula mucida]|nr:hypothetical protein CPB85DRAFT_54522 [Mucidula mucida]
MAFVSPSNKPIPAATSGSLLGQGYPSSAYSTSSGEDYFNLLRTGNEPQSPSTSPSSRYLSLSASVSRRVSPSVDELAPPTLPMLMGLSLPGTPENSIIAESFASDHFPTSPSATENDAEWTLSLSAMTPTESESMNPTPTSTSLSLSATSSFRVQLNLDATEHVVDFPSEAVSPLASSVAPSPAIPAIDGVADDPLGDSSLATSAAEYAAAVMSSAWSFDDPPLPPIGIAMPHHDRDSLQDQLDLDSSQGHRPDVQLEKHTQRKKGLMTKVKKIGGRLGRLLKLRKDVAEMRRPQSAPAIRTTTLVHTSARPSPRLPSLNIDLEESVLPLPSPLRNSTETNRLRRPRPRSRGHSFVTASRPHSMNLPEIQVLPPSVQNSPETSAPKSNMPTPAPQKTLAEIKTNRRFSLSAITNLGRPASPPPTPPPILVASRRRRPVSARLALPTSPRRRESLHFEEDASRPVSRSSRLDPPGLGLALLGVPGTSDGVSRDHSTAHSDAKTKDLKKGRRFSLSALSSLASGGGLREDGSSGWAGSSRL